VTRQLAVAGVALAIAVSAAGAIGAPRTGRPRTLIRTARQVGGLAQDATRVAWLTPTGQSCDVRVRALAAHRTQSVVQRHCGISWGEGVSNLSLAGRTAAWVSLTAGGNNEYDVEVFAASLPGGRAQRVAHVHGPRDSGHPVSYPTVAGAGQLLVFTDPTGVRRIVAGRARKLFAFSKPLAVAVDRDRIAVVRQELRPGDGCGCVSAPDWRSDGKIGFLSQLSLPPNGKKELTLIDPSGSGRTVLTDDNQWRFNLDWSLDGTKLAYSYTIGLGVTIAVAAPAHDIGPGDDPSLSADGSLVAFTRYNGADFIYVANAGGGAEHLVAQGDGPAWSPDGTKLVFTASGGRLSVMNADGTGVHQLGSIVGLEPDWSPDGTKVVYEGSDGIWVVDADGSHPRQVTAGAKDYDPHWSPDSHELVFASTRNGIGNGDDPPGQELYIVDADGSGLRPLTHTVPASWESTGQVRSSRGRLLSSFSAPGATRGVALAGARVAVVTQDLAGKGKLALFDVATGAARSSDDVPGTRIAVAGAGGHWVVLRTGDRTIRAFDVRTGSTTTLAVPVAAPSYVSVSGRRVVWAEHRGQAAWIRALTLPG
jgi:Tol biopolymer transport system component